MASEMVVEVYDFDGRLRLQERVDPLLEFGRLVVIIVPLVSLLVIPPLLRVSPVKADVEDVFRKGSSRHKPFQFRLIHRHERDLKFLKGFNAAWPHPFLIPKLHAIGIRTALHAAPQIGDLVSIGSEGEGKLKEG